jgi:hypothetical protein
VTFRFLAVAPIFAAASAVVAPSESRITKIEN